MLGAKDISRPDSGAILKTGALLQWLFLLAVVGAEVGDDGFLDVPAAEVEGSAVGGGRGRGEPVTGVQPAVAVPAHKTANVRSII